MPTRTIANGGGNFNATGTWVEGAVPTSADDVVATATSGQLTVNVASACRSIDLTSYVGTLTVSSTLTIGTTTTIASNIGLKFVAGMTLAGSAGGFTFANSSATPHTIDFGGKTVLTAMTINSNATISSNFTSSSTIAHTGRTLDVNGKSITCTAFSSSGSTTRVLTLTGGTITANLANAVAFTWAGTNLTVSTGAGSGTFVMSGANAGWSVTHTNLNFGILNITGSGNPAIAGVAMNMTFTTLTRTGTATLNDGFYLPATTINVTTEFKVVGAASNQRVWVSLGTRGTATPDNGTTPCTIALGAAGTSAANVNADFMDVTITGTNTPATGTRMGDCWGNTGITFDTSRTVYWVGNAGNWSDTAHWSLTSGGSSGAATPLPQDDVIINTSSITTNSQTIACDTNRTCRDLTMSPVTASPQLGTQTVSHFGSMTSSTAMFTGLSCTFRGRGTHVLSAPSSARLTGAAAFTAPGGSYTLTGNVFMNGACSLFAGTIALSSFTLTTNGTVQMASGTLVRAVDFGSGIWAFPGGNNLTIGTAASNLTITPGTGIIQYANTAGTGVLISNGQTMPNLLRSGVGGTANLGDAYTTAGTVTVTGGTFGTAGFALNYGSFTCTGSSTRGVSLGASAISGGSVTISGSGLTWTPSTSVWTMTSGTLSVTYASLTLGSHVFTPANAATITVDTLANTTFGAITCNGSSAGTGAVVFPASSTVTGAFTTTGNSGANRLQLWEPPWGGIATISAGSASLSNTDFHNIVGAGAATWTGTNTGFTYTGWRQQAIVTA